MIIWISSFKLMLIPHIDNTFGRVVGRLYGPWSCFRCGGPWSFVLRGYGWYQGFGKAMWFALSLAANWRLGTALACSWFSQQSRVMSLLCGGSALEEAGFQDPKKCWQRDYDVKGPTARLVRTEIFAGWLCDWAPGLFPVFWLNPWEGLGWGLSRPRTWLTPGFRVFSNQYFHAVSNVCVLARIVSDRQTTLSVSFAVLCPDVNPMAMTVWSSKPTSFPNLGQVKHLPVLSASLSSFHTVSVVLPGRLRSTVLPNCLCPGKRPSRSQYKPQSCDSQVGNLQD